AGTVGALLELARTHVVTLRQHLAVLRLEHCDQVIGARRHAAVGDWVVHQSKCADDVVRVLRPTLRDLPGEHDGLRFLELELRPFDVVREVGLVKREYGTGLPSGAWSRDPLPAQQLAVQCTEELYPGA